jgi:hypothetical protein
MPDHVASADIQRYVAGLNAICLNHVKRGFEPYIVSFMFRADGRTFPNIAMMRSEIERI